MNLDNYEDWSDNLQNYREWKIKKLLIPFNGEEAWGDNSSAYAYRHTKWAGYCNDKVGPYRSWKRYRKYQYYNKQDRES